jgi:malonate transporter MadM subunit
MRERLLQTVLSQGLLVGFAITGLVMWLSYWISARFTKGRIHGSALAVSAGLIMAWIGGLLTGGKNGIADIPSFAGIGLLGGPMFRDFAIVATAYGATFADLRRSGLAVVTALSVGLVLPFACGAFVAVAFGYRDAISITTIGCGPVTYIVGAVTGAALGAKSEVIALSIAAGLVKSIAVMLATPAIAKRIGLNNPHTAMVYGGLLGTHSGVGAGLAATDPRLVPYGLMVSTFYTGFGCLLGPSVFYIVVRVLC